MSKAAFGPTHWFSSLAGTPLASPAKKTSVPATVFACSSLRNSRMPLVLAVSS